MAKYGFNIRISFLEYECEASKKENVRKRRQDTGKQGKYLTLESSGELKKLRDIVSNSKTRKFCSSLLSKTTSLIRY